MRRIESQILECEDSGCWIWLGRSSRNGYGRISVKGTERQVHRILWAIEQGPIPHGLVLDHLCRNRYCVNPNHLEAVTVRTNTLRGVGPTSIHARQVCVKSQ